MEEKPEDEPLEEDPGEEGGSGLKEKPEYVPLDMGGAWEKAETGVEEDPKEKAKEETGEETSDGEEPSDEEVEEVKGELTLKETAEGSGEGAKSNGGQESDEGDTGPGEIKMGLEADPEKEVDGADEGAKGEWMSRTGVVCCSCEEGKSAGPEEDTNMPCLTSPARSEVG